MCHAPCKAKARAHATHSLARSRLAGDQSVLEADDRLGLRPPFGPRVTRLKDTLVAKNGGSRKGKVDQENGDRLCEIASATMLILGRLGLHDFTQTVAEDQA